jgi:uncharacterized protein (UPF0332 family)
MESDVAQRRVISACYYSQFHAARAIVLFHDKVDYSDHKELPKRIEAVLPGRGLSSFLQVWLEIRRTADYDPYPEFDPNSEAQRALTETEQFLNASGAFLKTAGVAI